MVLYHLFFLLCTAIRPRVRVLTNLFLLFVHDHLTKNQGFHWFISFMCTRPFDRNMWFSYIYYFFCAKPFDKDLGYSLFFFLYAHNHFIKICGPLPFIITFVHDHSTKKIRVLIYIFISFVHDHSTNFRGHSYFLIYSLVNCVYNSYATFIAVLIYFVHYIHVRTTLIVRTLCPWLYEVYAGDSY